MNPPECRRGEVWYLNFNPSRGSEQQGVRPALIIQNDTGNMHSPTTIVAAITSTVGRYPFTVVVEKNEGGLKLQSTVNCAQILTIDKTRLMKRIGMLSQDRMREVDQAIRISLALA